MNITVVWTPAAWASAAIGGFLVGLFLSRIDGGQPRRTIADGVRLAVYLVLIGACFWSGQIIDALRDNPPTVDRVVSRFVLWLGFSATAGVGLSVAYAASRLRRRNQTPIERAIEDSVE